MEHPAAKESDIFLRRAKEKVNIGVILYQSSCGHKSYSLFIEQLLLKPPPKQTLQVLKLGLRPLTA